MDILVRNEKREIGEKFWLVRRGWIPSPKKGVYQEPAWMVFRVIYLGDGRGGLLAVPRQVRTQSSGMLWVQIMETLEQLKAKTEEMRF